MTQDRIDVVSRRQALQQGLGAIAGVALAGAAQTANPATKPKLTKAAVKYVDHSKDEGKDCDDCIQFVPGKTAEALGTCKIVKGAINPHGHCIAFSPLAKK